MTKSIVEKMEEALRRPVPYEGLLGPRIAAYGEDAIGTPDKSEPKKGRPGGPAEFDGS